MRVPAQGATAATPVERANAAELKYEPAVSRRRRRAHWVRARERVAPGRAALRLPQRRARVEGPGADPVTRTRRMWMLDVARRRRVHLSAAAGRHLLLRRLRRMLLLLLKVKLMLLLRRGHEDARLDVHGHGAT